MPVATGSNDIMVRRLQQELDDKTIFAQGIVERANAGNRDLSENEREQLVETRGRIESLSAQIQDVSETFRVAYEGRNRGQEIGAEIEKLQGRPDYGTVEYRSAGAYLLDAYGSHLGMREASDRLETFYRAAAHQKTSDNLGVVPNPVIGGVINFVDGQRPLVTALGVQALPGARWSRPRVTQHTSVAVQGAAGAPADEKSELVSQKMVITEINGAAKTYGGYVNVSRQNIDFSDPQILDIIVNDLALQYALETEAAAADALQATGTAAQNYDMTPANGSVQAEIARALWAAAGTVYTAVKGAGRLILVFAPDRLAAFGPLFAPINPQDAFGSLGSAANFGQGAVGQIAGITGIMSAGLATGEAFLLSTAAVEAYEQRIGQLQVVEPSVLGLQVAYAGYFTTMTIEDDAIVPLVAA